MDNEKFGVELFALFNQSSFSSALGKLKNFGKQVEDSGKIGLDVDEAKLAYVKSQIDDIQEKLRQADAGMEIGADVFKLEYQLAKLKKDYQEIQDRIKGVNRETNNVTVSTKSLEQAVKKSVSGIKKFGLALVGIRSIYFGIRRAMTTYLSQNEELYNKLQASYYALGSMFAPVLEKILNIFVKLVSYVDVFVKALGFAGINMKNFNKNASASAKSVNKMLAGFDEINNLNTSKDTGVEDTPNLGNPFENVKLDTGWVKIIQDFGKWFKNNWEYVVGGLLGTKVALDLIKLGLDGVMATGIGLIIAGVVIAIKNLIEYLNDPTWKNFGGILVGIGTALLGIAVAITSWPVAIAGAIVLVLGLFAQFRDEINGFFDWLMSGIDNLMNWIENNISNKLGIVGDVVGTIINTILDLVKMCIEIIKEALNGVVLFLKGILDGIILMFKGDFVGGLKAIFDGIVALLKSVVNIVISAVEFVINTVLSGINVLVGGIADLVGMFGSLFGFSKPNWRIPKVHLPRLEVGTNYVPNDMVAEIHKGEAVIPKKFNSQEYFGNDNEETNSLLRQLIEVVDSKEFKAYISNKDIGKSAVNYINQQSRIMGGSIV